ncbi:Protein of uncharacterised function (DUF1366) [Streptococcus agalactiae]|uniref:hypothetical protein n=1 Tax=Streptococcus agalactiae TaxID=1311 RepID=UPI0005E81D74|nr:hypothetical protein [Streptococcus agalactiae]CFQ61174.1 Protein of uncharacterised function (DUF1366) [Streptococcus agalactiae]CNC34031.1 Protein of uncharacterised function (DUF1366) [Streptococcus agalactiae]
MEILNKYPVMLEDKSIAKVNAIVAVDLPHVRGNLTFDLPVDFDNKSFAETKDKAQSEKMTELSTSTSTGTQTLINLISTLYAKEVLKDEDLIAIG